MLNVLPTIYPIILAIGLMISGTGKAATVEFTIEDRGKNITQVAAVSDHKVEIKSVGGDPKRDMLFDAAQHRLISIDHRSKSYTLIDKNTINQVAALMDSVSSVVGSQQGVLADLLGTLGVDSDSTPRPKMTDAGRDLTIGNYSCRLYQSHLQSILQSEICIAENSMLKLNAADFQTLRIFLQFTNLILIKAGKLLTVLGVVVPEMNLEGSTGLPIGMHSAKDNLKVRVSRITADSSPQISTNLPAGYTRENIPFIEN